MMCILLRQNSPCMACGKSPIGDSHKRKGRKRGGGNSPKKFWPTPTKLLWTSWKKASGDIRHHAAASWGRTALRHVDECTQFLWQSHEPLQAEREYRQDKRQEYLHKMAAREQLVRMLSADGSSFQRGDVDFLLGANTASGMITVR